MMMMMIVVIDDKDAETGDANYENDDIAGGGDDFPPR